MWIGNILLVAMTWLSIHLLVRGTDLSPEVPEHCRYIEQFPLEWPSNSNETSSLEIAVRCNRLDLIRHYLEETVHPITVRHRSRSNDVI